MRRLRKTEKNATSASDGRPDGRKGTYEGAKASMNEFKDGGGGKKRRNLESDTDGEWEGGAIGKESSSRAMQRERENQWRTSLLVTARRSRLRNHVSDVRCEMHRSHQRPGLSSMKIRQILLLKYAFHNLSCSHPINSADVPVSLLHPARELRAQMICSRVRQEEMLFARPRSFCLPRLTPRKTCERAWHAVHRV